MVSETEVVGAVCSNHTPCREAQVSCFGKNNTQCLHCSLFLRMIGQRRLVLPFLLPFCVKALSSHATYLETRYCTQRCSMTKHSNFVQTTITCISFVLY